MDCCGAQVNADPSIVSQSNELVRLLKRFFALIDAAIGCQHKVRVFELSWHPSENGIINKSVIIRERTCASCHMVERSPFVKLHNVPNLDKINRYMQYHGL